MRVRYIGPDQGVDSLTDKKFMMSLMYGLRGFGSLMIQMKIMFIQLKNRAY